MAKRYLALAATVGLAGREYIKGPAFPLAALDIGGHWWAVRKTVSKTPQTFAVAKKKARNSFDGERQITFQVGDEMADRKRATFSQRSVDE